MISNITNTFIKAKKAFDISQFTESKNLLNEVIKHDKDFYVFTGSSVGVVPILSKGLYKGKIEKLGSVNTKIN